jgi:catechol 2,3-dioxygenase-like lactoylglutathione lyase family enzyme
VTSPFARVDHVVIAVRDLRAAADAYAAVLGRRPSWRGRHPAYGTANVLFGLGSCYLELLALEQPARAHQVAAALAHFFEQCGEGIFALALGSDDLDATAAALARAGFTTGPIAPGEGIAADGAVRSWRSFLLDRVETRGIALMAIQHDGAALPRAPAVGDDRAAVRDVDHVVLFSDDAAAAVTLWSERLGIPERWRRDFPERGTRNVGLRLGGVTLEFVSPLADGEAGRGERAWGIAYAVDDLEAALTRLRGAGIPASDARDGLAPRTRVCTVKWSDRLPTLLLQHGGRVSGGDRPAQV